MNANVQVIVNYKSSGFGMSITQVYLKNAAGEITLTEEQWDEIKTVMAGKRKTGYSTDKEGYTPHTASFWN